MALTYTSNCNPNTTMFIQTPLGTYIDGAPCKEMDKCSYEPAVSILQYLSNSAWPDIKPDVKQVAYHNHKTKLPHKISIKNICRYLKGTRYEEIIFNPSDVFKVYCYVYAGFICLWHVYNPEERISVKLCTGYIITLSGRLLVWANKSQQTVALIVSDSEYLAIEYSMRKVLTLKYLCEGVLSHLDRILKDFKIKITSFEDNMGCIYSA